MRKISAVFIMSLHLSLPMLAQTQIPSILNYQGRIALNGTNFDGVGYFKFALVDGGSNISLPAMATAVVDNGFITSCLVMAGGRGYTTPPAVIIRDSSGSNAVATAVLSGDAVGSLTIENTGSHYSSQPSVTIDAPPAAIVFQTFWANDLHGTDGIPFNSVPLTVSRGLYSVLLGDTNVLNMAPMGPDAFTNGDVRLRVWFSPADTSYWQFEQFSPDQRIASVGYAMNAINAGFAATAAVCLAVSPAIDVQGQRLNVGTSNTLAGPGATIAGGQWNTANGWLTTVSGGASNTAQASFATVVGGANNVAGQGGFLNEGTYAAVVGGQNNAATGTAAFIGGGAFNQASSDYATIGGGSHNNATNDHATIGGGAYNTAALYATVGGGGGNTAVSSYATVGGGLQNSASNYAALVSGGYQNIASGYEATVGGGQNNLANDQLATVAGGANNSATGPGSAIGGGGFDGSMSVGNVASGPAATIAGGFGNTAVNHGASVAGGERNIASGADSAVAGGVFNTASGPGAVVGGGGFDGDRRWGNVASGPAATVVGGIDHIASGYASTVAGGGYNNAAGAYSFAAGQWAKAAHDGAFVWGDTYHGWGNPFQSTSSNQFLIYASGGVGINTANLPEGGLVINTNAFINGHDLFLLEGDHGSGLGWYGWGKPFGLEQPSIMPNGPVLYGSGGGALGTTFPSLQPSLEWFPGGVKVPHLNVSGNFQCDGQVAAMSELRVFGEGHFVGGGLGLYTEDTKNGCLVVQTNSYFMGKVFLDPQNDLDIGNGSGLGWYGGPLAPPPVKPFNATVGTIEGPVLYGDVGGALATTHNGSRQAELMWSGELVSVRSNLNVGHQINVKELAVTDGIDAFALEVENNATFWGLVNIVGDVNVHGLKLFVVPHPTDTNKEIGYVAAEGPEAATFVRGSTNLVNGECVISLPDHYAMVTAEEGLTVQVTPRGEWLQLYVAEATTSQVTVREAQGKSGRFDYLVQGVRKGYENYQPIRPRGLAATAPGNP